MRHDPEVRLAIVGRFLPTRLGVRHGTAVRRQRDLRDVRLREVIVNGDDVGPLGRVSPRWALLAYPDSSWKPYFSV